MDGMRARILRRIDSVNGEAPVELVSKAAQLHMQAHMTRQPPPHPNGQPVTPETRGDPIGDDIEDFAHQTLSLLDAHHRRADFDRLAIFASPSMLRMLRLALPAGLKGSLMMDRPLNLIALPEGELRDRVRQLIHENDQNRGT
jgi:protein required for attachment to host cells